MTANRADHPLPPARSEHSVEDLFRGSAPITSANDLGQDGVFDDGELDEFLADLAGARRGDLGDLVRRDPRY